MVQLLPGLKQFCQYHPKITFYTSPITKSVFFKKLQKLNTTNYEGRSPLITQLYLPIAHYTKVHLQGSISN